MMDPVANVTLFAVVTTNITVLGSSIKHTERALLLSVQVDVGAAAFGYVFEAYCCFYYTPLQSGWWDSLGWWGVISVAMHHAQRNTTRVSASFSLAGVRVVEDAPIAPNTRRSAVHALAARVVRPEHGEGSNDPATVSLFREYTISIEVW